MAGLNDFREEFLAPGDYIVAHTSGSTGKPKAIRLSKDDMRRSARASNALFGVGADSLLACPLSADYIAGKMMVVRALEAGCDLVELPVSNSVMLPDTDRTISLLPVVPSQIDSLLTYTDLDERVSTILIGGGAPSAARSRALVDRGIRTYISYGMTETCSHVAVADGADPKRIFRAMPGISFSIAEDDRLVIDAPAFSFGTQTVNDIVELIDSRTFRLLGRADNVINSAGLKLHPEVLEQMYAAVLDAETEFYVRGEPSVEWGSSVLLVVEGSPALAEQAMHRLSASDIARRYLPKRAEAVERFERTASGKIIRRKG